MRGFRTPLAFLPFLAALGFTTACGDDGAGTGGGDSSTTSATATTDASSSVASTADASSSASSGCPGVIEDGVCVGKCSPDVCLPGNTCVGNRCTLTCDGHQDCYPGTTCTDAVEDDTGAAIKICTPSPKAPILGANCFFGNECDAWTVCPDGTACGNSVCGGQACTDGLCPDGSACTPPSCEPALCRSPRCLGAVPDAPDQSPSGSSYCTQNDCTADADCAPGMYCGLTRDFHKICGRTGIELATEDPCIDPEDFDADGATYQEGPVSLLRNTCLFRRQCSPCETDLDCSGVLGQVCGDIGGESRCVATCVADVDCERDAACLEDPAHPGVLVCTPRFGSCAGEGEFCEPCLNDLDCGDADTSQICYPLAGNQRGCFDYSFEAGCRTLCPDGTECDQYLCNGKLCIDGLCHQTDPCDADPCNGEACVDGLCPDGRDCDADPCDGLECIDGYCPDSIPCVEQTCTNSQCIANDEDCPLSPDGEHHGECLDRELGVGRTDPDYLKCFLPYFVNSNRFQCW
jgi:hypothetical protein